MICLCLDLMTILARCDYLSDLRRIDCFQRARLIRALEGLRAEDGDLPDWKDALAYFAGEASACATAEQGKTALIAALSARRETEADPPARGEAMELKRD